MEPRVFHVVRPRPPPTAPAVSPGVTLSCCVQRCPLPVFPVRDHGALLTLNGAAPLSSPSGAPRPRWSSRDGDAPAELSGGEPGGRWRPGSTDPIPEPELRTRCRRWGSRWGAECHTAAEPWGRSAARAQPGGAGGAVPGEGRGQPLRAGTGKRKSRPVGTAAIAEPRATRGKRGAGGSSRLSRGSGERRSAETAAAVSPVAPGKQCGTPADPPRPALQCAEPRPSRPTASRERSGAVRCGLRCVRHRPRGRRARSHQELPRVFLPVPSGRGAGAGAAGRSPGTPARYRFCFRGRRRFRSNGGRVPPASGIPHLPPPHKSRWIRRWRH